MGDIVDCKVEEKIDPGGDIPYQLGKHDTGQHIFARKIFLNQGRQQAGELQ